VNLVAEKLAKPLAPKGSFTWSYQFSIGPFPVTIAYTKNPKLENIANRPFFNSFTFNSAKVSGSSAKPRGSNGPPGYNLSYSSPRGNPFYLYASANPSKITYAAKVAMILCACTKLGFPK